VWLCLPAHSAIVKPLLAIGEATNPSNTPACVAPLAWAPAALPQAGGTAPGVVGAGVPANRGCRGPAPLNGVLEEEAIPNSFRQVIQRIKTFKSPKEKGLDTVFGGLHTVFAGPGSGLGTDAQILFHINFNRLKTVLFYDWWKRR